MNKMKEFLLRHEETIKIVACCTVGTVVGFGIGRYITKRNFTVGLGACMLVHPEIGDLIEDSTSKIEGVLG